MRLRWFLFALVFAISFARADSDDNKGKVIDRPVVADTAEKFAAQSAWIEAEMGTGGRYEFTSDADKRRVRSALGQMASLMQQSTSVAAMGMQDKVKLFNAQEEVNGILKHNDSNRLVCERRAPVGSNLPVTTCVTYGELVTRRGHDQKTMRDMQRHSDVNRLPPGG